MPDNGPEDLIEAYLQRRDALLRYFTLRTRSQAQAEDILQDLYLKIASLDAEVIAEIRNPGAFLYRTGSNLMLDRFKQQARSGARDAEWRRGQAVETGGEDAADLPAADRIVDAKQRLERVTEALNELSPQTRRAFRLHKFEGLSHTETAAQMGISRSAIEKHISAALRHLMRRLE